MKHKYLEEIGIVDRKIPNYSLKMILTPKKLFKKIARGCRLKKYERTYGVHYRDTWSLDFTFYMWLYERLRAYVDIAGSFIDITSRYDFEYKVETYSQLELINILESKLEDIIKGEFDDALAYECYEEECVAKEELIKEICEIWGILLPAMWWQMIDNY